MNLIRAIRAASWGILAGLGTAVPEFEIGGVALDLPVMGNPVAHVLTGLAIAGLVYSRQDAENPVGFSARKVGG